MNNSVIKDYHLFNDYDEHPIVSFVNNVLLRAIKNSSDEVYFERNGDCFTIKCICISQGSTPVIFYPPVTVWERVIRILKNRAWMADYGPFKSTEGYFKLILNNTRSYMVRLNCNINPITDNQLTLTITPCDK